MRRIHILSLVAGSVVVHCVVAACSDHSNGAADAAPSGGTTSGGQCGACDIKEPLRVLTANTDVSQFVGEVHKVVPPGTIPLAEGPFVLTGQYLKTGSGNFGVADAGTSCAEFGPIFTIHNETRGMMWGPIFFPAGKELCFRNPETIDLELTWSGYRPYSN